MRFRSGILIFSAVLGLSACGIDEYPYLEAVDSSYVVNDLETSDTLKITFKLESQVTDYLRGYKVLYRIYASDDVTDQGKEKLKAKISADRSIVDTYNTKNQSSLLFSELTGSKLRYRLLSNSNDPDQFDQTFGAITTITFDFNSQVLEDGRPKVTIGVPVHDLVRKDGEYFITEDMTEAEVTETAEPTHGDIEMVTTSGETFNETRSNISVLMYIIAYGRDASLAEFYSNATLIGKVEIR